MDLRRAADESVYPTEPGTYRRVVERWARYHGRGGARFWAEVCCPRCLKVSLVGRNHEVSEGGVVSPSYVCPYPPCSFHEFVRLLDWERPAPLAR